MNTDTLLQALRWRYATKVFDPNRKIPAPVWAALEEALVLSASSFGLQPYRFLVVDDPSLRQQLMPHAWNQRQVVDASHFIVFAARTTITEADIDRWIARIAEVRNVPRESLNGYRSMMTGMLLDPSFAPQAVHWAAKQAYLALGNLLTCAALLGVDACPIEGFVPAEFDRILHLPEQGYTSVVCCALGYRSADDKYATLPKVRLPGSELIQHI
ncbi:NAD(P)H-dependent oxidoreductase [Limisphaera ngatamarikiensis]|jgi:nitroreductase|uniref:NAD(P)H-dependent oxidoreductase n=1 Tax=Limisphaera ngatamarikiensis TaxID=1324935 RepID=A0A6M1RCQ4_9BACT|nr:NAD(P)H-dependent oxidoreductase [Limisphaera ngatamarikiensis]NGO37828.1 NAD(P)H-dependent oxidoreductase [Limisphaera ngatamarikiensis]